DSRKITLREYWNILPSWKVLIPWVAGWFNVPIRFGSGFRKPETVRELEVIESQFPSAAGDKLQPVLEHCLQLGFHSPRFFSFENLRRDTRTSFIALLHRSGELTLRLMHTIATNVHPPVQTVLLVLMSELTDGTLVFTSDQKAKFRSRPGTLDHRLVGAPPAKLLESHQKKLAALHLRNPPRLIESVASLDDAWDRHEQSSMELKLRRGLYMRMSPQHVASA